MKLRDIPKEDKPREKLARLGAQNLTSSELLAIILKTGTKKEDVLEVSNKLINKYGLDKLSECSLVELQEIEGIGFAKACEINALFEFNRRHNMAKTPIKKISSAEDVFNLFHERLKDEKQEHFYILMLSTKNHIIGEHLVSKGVLDAAILEPREVFRPAIKAAASKIIILHNHPSGDPTPSEEDLEVTQRLIDAGKMVNIQLLDHVIIGSEKWWNWKEKSP